MEVGEESPEVDEHVENLTTSHIQHVFVIAMENHDPTEIYGNTSSAHAVEGVERDRTVRSVSGGQYP
jgi:hypothetical protein